MVAKAKVRIEGEDATAAAFRSAVGNANKAANQMSGAFKAAFAGISLVGLASVAHQAIELGDDLNKAAIKAGITGKAMSELNYVAKQSDVDLGSLSSALKKMQVALSQAATGGKQQTEALAALGLTIEDLKGLKADEQFELIGDRISALKGDTDRTRAAVELFGKAGSDLLPLFSEGAKGIRALREEAVELGISLSDQQIAKLAEADTALKTFDASWRGLAATMVSYVAPRWAWTLDRLIGKTKDLHEQIADLEDELANARGNRGMSVESVRAGIQSRLDALRAKGKRQSEIEMGIGTGDAKAPPGFKNTDAAAAAQKIADAQLAEQEKLALNIRANDIETSAQLKKLIDEDNEKRLAALEEVDQTQREMAERWKEYQEEQATAISENAQLFKDAFMNAWDDMVNNGKLNINELFNYLIAEFARRGISKLFDSMFAPGGGGLGGLIDKGFSWAKGLLGFADGGRPPTDRPSIIGERGPEIWKPDGTGQVLPNNLLGGNGVSIDARTTIDARGASMELVKVLPKMMEQNRKATIAEITYLLKRRMLPIG